jgi:hypothetical protein
MSCGCTSSYDGVKEIPSNDMNENPSFVSDLNFSDIDEMESEDFRFVDDGEKYSNFLTKKMREKRKQKKEMKTQTNLQTLPSLEASEQAMQEMAVTPSSNEKTMPQNNTQGFFQKNKMIIILGGVGVLLVGGYFLLGKRLGIR